MPAFKDITWPWLHRYSFYCIRVKIPTWLTNYSSKARESHGALVDRGSLQVGKKSDILQCLSATNGHVVAAKQAAAIVLLFNWYDKNIAWAVWTSFTDLTVTLGALMCSPSIFSIESFLMHRSNAVWYDVYNEGCGAAGVNEARLHHFISGTKSLESIPSTHVSDTRAYNRASNGTKPHRCCRKSQISGDGADTRIARVHGNRCGSRPRMHRKIAIVQRPMNSTLKMRSRIL